ncbi:MAG: Rpn family recombination-promoting nuclease/putative transposase [Chromatiales bacterium]|nr:Rpn family recombination-promoting nuclease/putative transposase [Chromatiales bacterium]
MAALINDLRPDLPPIEGVEILNPGINAEELRGKYIILDVLARDAQGHGYNIEIQVRRYGAWRQRGLYYLARMLGQQLGQGEDYGTLRAAIGSSPAGLRSVHRHARATRSGAVALRDARRAPAVDHAGEPATVEPDRTEESDRLKQKAGPLAGWVTFFEHWREEQTMATIEHAPIREALNRVRQLSADDEARRLAFVRERALHDEISLLKEAREEGQEEAKRATALAMLQDGLLDEDVIARYTGLTLEAVRALRQDPPSVH